jgi:hypothetical protein
MWWLLKKGLRPSKKGLAPFFVFGLLDDNFFKRLLDKFQQTVCKKKV